MFQNTHLRRSSVCAAWVGYHTRPFRQAAISSSLFALGCAVLLNYSTVSVTVPRVTVVVPEVPVTVKA